MAKPIKRSDGKLYASLTDAARDVVTENGVGNVKTVRVNISNVARNVPHHKSAYGYGWEYGEPIGDAYDEALRKIAALEDLARDMYEGIKMDDRVFQAFARDVPGAYEIMRDPCLCEYRRAAEFEPRMKELGIEVGE